jgi:hypothetical protein
LSAIGLCPQLIAERVDQRPFFTQACSFDDTAGAWPITISPVTTNNASDWIPFTIVPGVSTGDNNESSLIWASNVHGGYSNGLTSSTLDSLSGSLQLVAPLFVGESNAVSSVDASIGTRVATLSSTWTNIKEMVYSPLTSSVAILLVDPSSWQMIVSPNEFTSGTYLGGTSTDWNIIDITETAATVIATTNTCAWTGIEDALVLDDRLLLATSSGLLSQSTVATGGTWQRIVDGCVEAVTTFTESAVADVITDVMILVATSQPLSLYIATESTSGPYVPLLDSPTNTTLQEHFSDADNLTMSSRIIACETSQLAPTLHLTLVDVSGNGDGVAILYQFDRTALVWSRLFIFATNVSSTPGTRVTSGVSQGDIINRVTGMASSATFTLDLFVWGNALLYSGNSGETFRVIRTFTDTYITTFAGSSSGMFAFNTADGQLWFGNSPWFTTIQLIAPRYDFTAHVVYFDGTHSFAYPPIYIIS